MTSNDFIAAWKDPAVRAHLSEHELSILPVNPAGHSPFDVDPDSWTASAPSSPTAVAALGLIHATHDCLRCRLVPAV
jgi:mersacidin/lichenicidin family type 2 lantibiotic